MVHTFKCLDRTFAFDTESGSAFEISDLVKKLIDKKISPQNEGDFLGYSQSEIDEANREIEQLIKEGVLFSLNNDEKMPEYEGIVKALCLNVSHNCSLKCTYCFASEGTYGTKRINMDLQTALNSIDFLIEKSGNRRNLEVDFFGGEPLLNLDVIKKTVSYARQIEKQKNKNFRFTLTTNGINLTDEIIDYLNKEMYNVVISIDGRKQIHDELRKDLNNNPTFDKILKNALKFREKRGDDFYYIRGTFTQNNKDFSLDALALNDYGFDQISLEPVVLPKNNPLALKESDIESLKQEYEKLAKEYIERRKTDKWFNFFHFMIDFNSSPCIKKRIKGCGAGSEYLAISPNGDIYPCHRFDSNEAYKIGNINQKTFNDSICKTFYNSNIFTKTDCKDCFCKYFCSGGCAATSIEFERDINKNNDFSCQLMKKRTETAIAIYAIENQKD